MLNAKEPEKRTRSEERELYLGPRLIVGMFRICSRTFSNGRLERDFHSFRITTLVDSMEETFRKLRQLRNRSFWRDLYESMFPAPGPYLAGSAMIEIIAATILAILTDLALTIATIGYTQTSRFVPNVASAGGQTDFFLPLN